MPAVSLLCLGVDFKDLQSRHFRFHRLGSFLKNTSRELCRYPFVSAINGPHPILLPIRPKNESARFASPRYKARINRIPKYSISGFPTRFAPCLPLDVKVLFQTGNTLGFVSQTGPEYTEHLSATNELGTSGVQA